MQTEIDLRADTTPLDLDLCEVDATEATLGGSGYIGELFILPTFWHGG